MDSRGWALVTAGLAAIVFVAVLAWPTGPVADANPRPVVPAQPPDLAQPSTAPTPSVEPAAASESSQAAIEAEWATLEAAVLTEDPGAMARVREFVDAHAAVHPPPSSLMRARSIATLMDVSDAARSLRAGR